jgi:hypothetical protein
MFHQNPIAMANEMKSIKLYPMLAASLLKSITDVCKALQKWRS